MIELLSDTVNRHQFTAFILHRPAFPAVAGRAAEMQGCLVNGAGEIAGAQVPVGQDQRWLGAITLVVQGLPGAQQAGFNQGGKAQAFFPLAAGAPG